MMKKKMALLLAAALTMTTILTGCGGGNEENADKQSDVTAEDAKEENASGDSVSEGGTVFTVGFDAEYPPYGYMDENGEYTGFDLELAQAVCDLEGWELVKKPINWDSKDMELNSGSIDCIWNGFTMNGREDQYTWTDPYMDNSQVVVVKKDSGINTLADLAGKVVEVQKESAAETALNDEEHADLMASFAQLLSVGEYNTAFMDLESGAVDAVAIDIGVAQFQIEGKEDQYQILDETISSEQYAVGFFLGNTALRDEVQSTLLEMVEDGTFAEISNQYFGYDVCTLGK